MIIENDRDLANVIDGMELAITKISIEQGLITKDITQREMKKIHGATKANYIIKNSLVPFSQDGGKNSPKRYDRFKVEAYARISNRASYKPVKERLLEQALEQNEVKFNH